MNDTARRLANIPVRVWQRGTWFTRCNLAIIGGSLGGALVGQYWETAVLLAICGFFYTAGVWAFQELDDARADADFWQLQCGAGDQQLAKDGLVIIPIPEAGRGEIDVTLPDGRWISGYLYEKADR